MTIPHARERHRGKYRPKWMSEVRDRNNHCIRGAAQKIYPEFDHRQLLVDLQASDAVRVPLAHV